MMFRNVFLKSLYDARRGLAGAILLTVAALPTLDGRDIAVAHGG
ncbi:hypothetical protein [Kribbella sp. NPDC048928]